MADTSPSKSFVLPGITPNSAHNLSNKNLQQHFTSIGSSSSRTHDRAYSLDSSAGDSDGAPSISLHGSRYVNPEVALTSRQLQQLFPYHISVDKDFNVVQMGEKLYPLVRCILSPNSNKKRINQHISKYFKIVSPASMINNWDVKMLSNLHLYSPTSGGLIEIELVGPRSPMGLSAPRYAEDTLQAQAVRLVLKGRFHELDAYSSAHHHNSSTHAIHEDEDESEGSGKANGADGPGGVYLFILYPSNQGTASGDDWSTSPFAHINAASEKVTRRHTSDNTTSEMARLMAENAALLAENERLKEEATGKDMRGMIGNVAHDLKTPLAAFMGGVELINDMARDCELLLASSEQQLSRPNSGPGSSSTSNGAAALGPGAVAGTSSSTTASNGEGRQTARLLGSLRTSLKGISQQAAGVRDINQFMTMTINRCIDYTKASQGVKLVPRNETVNLTETLAMPINCMIASQTKVAFRLHNPPLDICTHVITDKIWLQENMLCLLSNAAKYSNAGRVDIKISLFPAQCLDEAADRAAAILSASTPTTTGSHKTDARPPTENICGPLSAKQVTVIHNQRAERSALAAAASPGHIGHSLSSSSKDSHRHSSAKRNGSIGPTSPLSPTATRRSTQVPPPSTSNKVLSPVQAYRSTISGSIDVSASAEAAARHVLGINIPPHMPSYGAGAHAASPIAGSKEDNNNSNNASINNNSGISRNPDGSPRVTSGRMYSRPRAGTATDPLLQPPKELDDYVNSTGHSTPKSTAALSPIAHPNNLSSLNGGHHASTGAHGVTHGRAAPSPTNHHHGGLISTAIGNAMGLIKGTTGKFKSGSSPSHSRGASQSNSQAQSRAHSRSQSADVNENGSLAGSVTSSGAGGHSSSHMPLGKVRLSKAEKMRHSVRGGDPSHFDDTDSLHSLAHNGQRDAQMQEDIEAMAMRGSFSSDGEGELDADRASVFSDYSRASSRQVSTDSRQYSTDSRQNYRISRSDADMLMRSFGEETVEEESAKTLSQHHLLYSGSPSMSYSPSSHSYLAANNLLPATPVEVYPQPSGGLFNRPIQKLQTSANSSNGNGSNSSSNGHDRGVAAQSMGMERPAHITAPSPTHHHNHHHTHSTAAALSPLLLVEIEDTGIGLTESNMNKLYSPFMQAQRLAGGTGLGLYSLSKRLDALGGHYGVECRKDGAPGSLFWFAIPYREDADAASSNPTPGKFQRQNSSRLEDLILSIQPTLKNLGLAEGSSKGPNGDFKTHGDASGGIEHMEAISEKHEENHGSAKSIADPEPAYESAPHSLHCSSNSSSSLRTSTGSVPPFHPPHHSGGTGSGGASRHHSYSAGQHSPSSASAPAATSTPVLPASVGVGGSRPMHFLLVDDSESILKVTSMLLTRSGHTVERAENGVIALDKIAASIAPGGRAFDVVLMDLLMPVLDGLEATRRLREQESEAYNAAMDAARQLQASQRSSKGLKFTPELPRRQVVIGLSANGDDETANDAYSAGVDRFIEKPFSLQKLLEALQDMQCEGL